MSRVDPVFDDHRAQVYAWAYRIVQRDHDALDVTQDVYLRWQRRGDEGAALVQPAAWLRRVTMNRALDVLRERARDAGGAQAAASSGGIGIDALDLDASHQVEAVERRTRVAAALGRISERQREVIAAKVFDGLTFAAIAAQLNLSVPTVKTHYLRGVSVLRELLHAERVG